MTRPAAGRGQLPARDPDVRANGLSVAIDGSGQAGAVWMGKAGSSAHLVLDVTDYWW